MLGGGWIVTGPLVSRLILLALICTAALALVAGCLGGSCVVSVSVLLRILHACLAVATL